MNERINAIQIQAMSIVMNGDDPDKDVDRMYIPAEFTKKFAELILNECYQYLNEEADRLYALNHDDGDLLAEKCYDIMEGLKEHFGIKE